MSEIFPLFIHSFSYNVPVILPLVAENIVKLAKGKLSAQKTNWQLPGAEGVKYEG